MSMWVITLVKTNKYLVCTKFSHLFAIILRPIEMLSSHLAYRFVWRLFWKSQTNESWTLQRTDEFIFRSFFYKFKLCWKETNDVWVVKIHRIDRVTVVYYKYKQPYLKKCKKRCNWFVFVAFTHQSNETLIQLYALLLLLLCLCLWYAPLKKRVFACFDCSA